MSDHDDVVDDHECHRHFGMGREEFERLKREEDPIDDHECQLYFGISRREYDRLRREDESDH